MRNSCTQEFLFQLQNLFCYSWKQSQRSCILASVVGSVIPSPPSPQLGLVLDSAACLIKSSLDLWLLKTMSCPALSDISSMWLEWICCIRWISCFHSLPHEKSRHWVSFWEFIAICWWHFRDHSAYLTNSQMEANSLFWPLKPKILLISSPDQKKKNLFMLTCWDYRQANLIFCVGRIRTGLFERFVV